MSLDKHSLDVVFALWRFRDKYPKWRLDMAHKIVEEEILNVIKKRMADSDFSNKIIQATRIDDISVDTNGIITYRIISDYESYRGFDVSKAREEGTKRHYVAPKYKKALSWVEGAQRFFSGGHWVRGIKQNRIIEKTIKGRANLVQRKFDRETDKLFLELVVQHGSN